MSRFAPHAEYLASADILVVRLRPNAVARTLTLGHWRNIDLDADGNVVAAEFVNAEGVGVDLAGIPEHETVARIIRESGIASLQVTFA